MTTAQIQAAIPPRPAGKPAFFKMKTNSRTARGGKRAGAGRPIGRTASSASITLPNDTWAKIDAERGPRSRSKYIEERVSAPKPAKNPAN